MSPNPNPNNRSAPRPSRAPAAPGGGNADAIILTSALVVGGAYMYRRLIESGGVQVSHPLPSFGRWATGYGVAFFGVAVVAQVSPDFGAWLAVLIAAGTILVQGGQLAIDVNHKLSQPTPATPAKTPAVGVPHQ